MGNGLQKEYPTGVYREQVGYPLAQAKSIADIDAYPWPDPDWYGYPALPDLCALYENRAIEIGYTAIFYYHNKLRGLELSLTDLALRPKFSHHLIRRIADFFLAYHERCFAAAQGLMHITQVTDDFGSQKGLLISKEMFNEFYRPWIQRAIDQAKRYGLKVFHHDDGAIYPLIPDLIEMGIDVLNPIQWRCPGMERETLSREFAGKVCFHGGVDNQYTLSFSSPKSAKKSLKIYASWDAQEPVTFLPLATTSRPIPPWRTFLQCTKPLAPWKKRGKAFKMGPPPIPYK